MAFLLSFLEGIITFVSPCLLPMLPIYLFYFAGDDKSTGGKKGLANALGFVLGFTAVFLCLGALSGTAGLLLRRHQTVVNLVTGCIVVLFGLNYLGVFRIGFLNFGGGVKSARISGFLSAFVFGLIFSVSWTPCVGAFLGSALMLASQRGSALQGVLLLLCYSAGLGIPFLISALLIDRLKSVFDFVKRHYNAITKASGLFLILIGILMGTGRMNALLSAMTF